MGCNAFSVDEFAGTVSQGRRSSPAGANRQPWADGFESRWDSRTELVRSSRMKAVNKAAVCNVLKAYPNAKTRGFTTAAREFLLSAFKDPFEDGEILTASRKEELIDLFQEQFPPKIIPDLFEIDADNKIIRLFEIEDTHPLTNEKLEILIEWWSALDGHGINLELFVTDRYGFNIRKIDLAANCFDQKFDLPPNSNDMHRIAKNMGIEFDPLPPKP